MTSTCLDSHRSHFHILENVQVVDQSVTVLVFDPAPLLLLLSFHHPPSPSTGSRGLQCPAMCPGRSLPPPGHRGSPRDKISEETEGGLFLYLNISRSLSFFLSFFFCSRFPHCLFGPSSCVHSSSLKESSSTSWKKCSVSPQPSTPARLR